MEKYKQNIEKGLSSSMKISGFEKFENAYPKLSLLIWIAVILGLGTGMGIFFGPDAWFRTLIKPTWNPPNWIFAPMWTALYVMMGISVWLVRRNKSAPAEERHTALLKFWVQFALNLAWTPIFFGLHIVWLAFFEICLLWLLALSTTHSFGKISQKAGYLLVPYMMWLSFALVLNGTIWLLNK